jgi:hypothetical protein
MDPRRAIRHWMFAALLPSLSSCWLSHERDPCPPADVPAVCTTPADRLRWTALTPAGAGSDVWLTDVGGTGVDDVWVVGARAGVLPGEGAIVAHRDATSWSSIDVPSRGGWSSVWASTPDDLWLAGASEAAHYDGRDWTTIALGPMPMMVDPVWADCRSRTWIGSKPPDEPYRLTRVDGIEPTDVVPLPDGAYMSSIWGSGANDIWVVGEILPRPLVMRGDGSSWSEVSYRPASALASASALAVWGAGPGDVWVVGGERDESRMTSSGTIDHWDGTQWSRAALPDGPDTTTFTAVWGTGPRDVWAVDISGPLLHFDGDRWTWIAAAPTRPAFRPQGWSADPCHVLIINGDTVLEGAP